ncbi:g6142 [Coccomyxa viridis]|uniref:Pyruvate carboxylase n=1 Tax=Coccomyxa viridis TaxID=1274662 RepID=A0ABP1FZI4_9CHLO
MRTSKVPRRSLHLVALKNYSGHDTPVSSPVVNEKGIVIDAAEKTPFKRILCANRGEIAVRVFRAGTELGLRTLAIYSEADRLQPHRYKADESYEVGAPDVTPVQCYLDYEGILALAKEQGADCIHPGYGFLSENADFARRCEEEGIAFIGPRPETIHRMGDKTEARKAAGECGVPVVPGSKAAITNAQEALEFARSVGLPVMLKAAYGGGGRGMRVVKAEEELEDAFERASKEAQAAFGNGSMFVEKLVEEPRHIEVQILADNQGNVVHLYERDCSVQRRHQKVVEVAPAFGLDPEVRAALHRDAVKLCQHVGYRNAGTVEFMVDKHGDYYFLEVNPRIQVEHTCTEEVTGVDLVQAQIRIAGGASLADLGLAKQEDIQQPMGYAIQCRITSEDPELNFQPDSGRIQAYRSPGGPGIRLDGAMATGNIVGSFYDSLLVKVICRGNTYLHAIQKMQRALYEFHIRGVKTNILFLENVLRHPEFLSGQATTSFIDRNAQLFNFNNKSAIQSSKLLTYLADLVVNGPSHPGAVGLPPSKVTPPPPAVPKDIGTQHSWRDVLLEKGPEGWAKDIRAHSGLLLTDTTWRDAHQSLLATRMRTHDMVKAAPATAKILAPCASLEMWGGATFDVALRFLHEDPWRRLDLLRERVPNIPFQMLLRGVNAVGYTSYPDNVVTKFVVEAKKSGIDIFRVFDSLNYLDNLKFGLDAVHAAGGVVEGTICYTGDILNPELGHPKYTLDYYMEMAEKLVEHGIHTLGIKDMAGLLKPRAASQLVGALRERFPELVLHVHTHDTAGTGVATQLACANAGADIVDCAIDSMSGTTSQPSMGAIVNALHGTSLATGIDPLWLARLSIYWEQTRGLYAPFESDLRSSSSDVYYHEMPGGQFTNLKFQALSLGLGDRWEKVKDAYAHANRALGDIVKVTPSSKVVGDLAQFMVQNELTEKELVDRAETLDFPSSVVEFLQGMIGQPTGGFPEPLRSRVIKDLPKVEGRPGATMPPLNLVTLEGDLKEKHDQYSITPRDVLSAALYPKVFDEFKLWEQQYSKFTAMLPTRAFLAPMDEDEEIEVELSKGNSVIIKYKALSELQPNGKREVFFESNGVPRAVEVVDKKSYESDASKSARGPARDKADPLLPGSVAAPMGGEVIEVKVKPGSKVKAGQAMVVLSAMKMETSVSSPVNGTVKHVAVSKGDQIEGGDLVVSVEEQGEGAETAESNGAPAAGQQEQPATA